MKRRKTCIFLFSGTQLLPTYVALIASMRERKAQAITGLREYEDKTRRALLSPHDCARLRETIFSLCSCSTVAARYCLASNVRRVIPALLPDIGFGFVGNHPRSAFPEQDESSGIVFRKSL